MFLDLGVQCIQVKEGWTQAAYTRSITLSLFLPKESTLSSNSGILKIRTSGGADMTVYPFKTNFGIRLKPNVAEKLHSFIDQKGGNRNALFNKVIDQYIESQSNKEPSEVA